jgi:deazaflavin-dependent oxidoreductase (nitroreductase family)
MRTLLLTARGRRSGRPRETALMYLEYGPALAIVASNLGSDRALDWWLNLECDPDAHVRLGAERRALRARRASPDEQALLWPRFVEMYRDYALYQRRTKRAIPIVMLEPR